MNSHLTHFPAIPGPIPVGRSVAPADPVAEVLEAIRLRRAHFGAFHLTGPWGYWVAPGFVGLYLVKEGDLHLVRESGERVELGAGDLAVVMDLAGHRLLHSPGASLRDWDESVPERAAMAGGEGWRPAGTCVLLGGTLECMQASFAPSRQALPGLVVVRGSSDRAQPWVREIASWMERELDSVEPGAGAAWLLLARLMLVQAVRVDHRERPPRAGDWNVAAGDPGIGPALGLMHARPEEDWTVSSLARAVGMSRSAFSARFHEKVGDTPLRYLLRCRMEKTCALLRDTHLGLKQIASEVGYRSVASFSHAVRRWTGMAPGAYRSCPVVAAGSEMDAV